MNKEKKLSRRHFLTELVCTGGVLASAAVVGDSGHAQTVVAPSRLRFGTNNKTVLTQNDFKYIGSFQMPQSSGGKDTDWSRTLTHRYVNGQLRFLSTTHQGPSQGHGEVYEVAYPGSSLSSYPTAAVARHWGDVCGSKLVDDSDGGGSVIVYGLFWDSIGQRLYWSYGNAYNASAANNPCFGATTLNDSTGSASPVAAWRMGNCKPYQYGITAIPSWFATQYTNGRRLGVGFGGRTSAESVGPSSDGPALAAIDPPTQAHLSTIPNTPMVGYPCDPSHSDPYYCRRPAGYSDQIGAGGHPRGPFSSYGGWQWMDFVFQTGVWIDTPTKHGFIFLPFMGFGNITYSSSTIHSSQAKHMWFVMDPMDFAAVAQGKKNQYDVIPASYWEVQFPCYDYPLSKQDDEPYMTPQGVTFDSTNNRLYVMLPWASGNYPIVAVYQVS